MPILVHEVVSHTGRGLVARVEYGDDTFPVEIVGDVEVLAGFVGQTLSVEFGFESISGARIVDAHTAARLPRIMQLPTGAVQIVGLVSNVSSLDESVLFDVQLQPGQEFLVFDGAELASVRPKIGEYVQVLVNGLCCFSTNV